MQAATVDMLVRKGKFDPPVAVAVADAIDMAISGAELVTVPTLDARLAAFDVRMETRFARIDARFADIDVSLARIDARFEVSDAHTDAKLQKMKTELIFWIIAITVGNSHLPKIAAVITEAIRELLSSA